jgi:hypothetical protein
MALAGFDPAAMYGDGLNPYLAFAANPVTYTDPTGLTTFDWFGEANAMELEITGQKLYALGAINEGARWAAIGMKTALDIGGALLGVDVLDSVMILKSGRGGFWEGMDVFLAVAPFGRIIKAGDKLHSAAKFARRAKGAMIAADTARDLAKVARRIDKRSAWYQDAVKRAEKLYPKKAGRTELHHVVPQYLGGPIDGPMVPVNAAYHQWITNEFRTKRTYGLDDKIDAGDLQNWMKEVYNKYPLPE